MNKILILAIVGVTAIAAQSSSSLLAVGTFLGELDRGFCLAFQDDTTDTTTTCYMECDTSGTMIVDLFDTSKYTNGEISTSEFLKYGQTVSTQLQVQVKNCKTTEFLMSIYNRCADKAFAFGTLSNVATQVGTTVLYWAMSTYLDSGNSMKATFTSLFNKCAPKAAWDQTWTYINAQNWRDLSTVWTRFALSLVSYKAPSVNTQ